MRQKAHCLEKFQLTRSRGARHFVAKHLRRYNKFQLTRSRGARQYRRCRTAPAPAHFNSRAHVERDSLMSSISSSPAIFQLTRSRGARPAAFLLFLSPPPISTHALTWSATRQIVDSFKFHICISTHALTWSATTRHCFFHQHSGISTHALTWSATHYRTS